MGRGKIRGAPSLSIERHPDGYLACFPALEGCNTWGKTYEEAVEHVEEALALYFETFDQLGKSITEERGQNQSPSGLGGASAIELVRALEKAGFDIIRQKGRHIALNSIGSARILRSSSATWREIAYSIPSDSRYS